MKKPSAFILAFFYLSFSIGATLHQHYCMGELVGISLFNLKDEKCGKCGMEKHTEASKYCCKDVSIVVKPGDSHTFTQIAYDLTYVTSILPVVYNTAEYLTVLDRETTTTSRAHSPPLLKNPLFIRFQNFRI